MSDFKGQHFEGEIVLWAARRYCRGEPRIVERAFGLSPSALAEAVQFVGKRFEHEAA